MDCLPELDISRAPPVLFFYGLAGAGKTHVGKLASRLSGRFFYDADDDISAEMHLALTEQRPFTEVMRDEFFPRVAQKILSLQQRHAGLVVTQGVYKQRHRDYLRVEIPGMEMLCVSCSPAVLRQRLALREQGISSGSAAALLADFEAPAPGMRIIDNDADDASIVQQLNRLYAA